MSVESLLQVLVSPNKVCWVADASVYTFMFVLYAGIVHVLCYRGRYVKTGNVNTILGKLHKIIYAILTKHNTYLGHTGFAMSFQRWKACLVEIGQTAHKLETNARANFPMEESLAYQCMENGGRNMATLIFSWLTVAFRHNIETNSST